MYEYGPESGLFILIGLGFMGFWALMAWKWGYFGNKRK